MRSEPAFTVTRGDRRVGDAVDDDAGVDGDAGAGDGAGFGEAADAGGVDAGAAGHEGGGLSLRAALPAFHEDRADIDAAAGLVGLCPQPSSEIVCLLFRF